MRANLLEGGRISAEDLGQAEVADGAADVLSRVWAGMLAAG